MAKKAQRIIAGLTCTVCKCQNYMTERSKLNTPEKLKLRKYCPKCRKHTEHKESGKLD
ncbi:MAG: 50S ribosomal protein L33 [Candidatus Gottesmanbacteria bacterium]|nr:50S ribosomal protein L33 [Candidatus Gottesmanbacteria bacterium]